MPTPRRNKAVSRDFETIAIFCALKICRSARFSLRRLPEPCCLSLREFQTISAIFLFKIHRFAASDSRLWGDDGFESMN